MQEVLLPTPDHPSSKARPSVIYLQHGMLLRPAALPSIPRIFIFLNKNYLSILHYKGQPIFLDFFIKLNWESIAKSIRRLNLRFGQLRFGNIIVKDKVVCFDN